MSLLSENLPLLSLRPRIDPSEFFDKCEVVAQARDYGVDRRRNYAGPGFDHLNLFIGGKPDILPMIRMVSFPKNNGRINIDVVDDSVDLVYDQYVPNALTICRQFLREYALKSGVKLRLGVPIRRPHFDPSNSNFGKVSYARVKFECAIRDMATGMGDVRARLEDAFLTIHLIQPSELPEPLNSELCWIYHELSKRPARWKGQGTVAATTSAMTRKKGAQIAERILAVYDALVELDEQYCSSA